MITPPIDAEPRPERRWWHWLPALLLAALPFIALAVVLGGGMRGVATWYLAQLALPFIGLAALVATLYHAFRRDRWGSGPVRATLAASLFLCLLIVWSFGLLPIPYPAALARTAPAATVGLPSDLPMTVAWGGNSVESNYHAVTPDQRWAYDLVMAPYFSGSETLTDYGCYGTPVLAPADGFVTLAVNDQPDEMPGKSSNNIDNPGGNEVGIRLDETGTYLLIAHMRPGSVRVEAGDRVSEGQPIGECGNSGNTSEPHIHIHHQRQDPADFPIGFAEGLPLYFRDHNGPAMPVGGLGEVDGTPVARGDEVVHQGQ